MTTAFANLNPYAFYGADFDFADMFAPDFVLPEQTGDPSLLCGEKRLMLAVLQDAAGDFMRGCVSTFPVAHARYEIANEWISDRKCHGRGVFGFEQICEALGLDADWIREGLDRWRERARRGEAQPPPRANRVVGSRTSVTYLGERRGVGRPKKQAAA